MLFFRRLYYFRYITCLVVLAIFIAPAYGQTDSLKSISRSFTNFNQKNLTEKVFVHLDRPLYLAGETMWFKIYVADGTFHKPLPLSKIAYVEVLDQEKKPVLQGKIVLTDAKGNGSFQLPGTFPSGNYTLRSYTSWMKNGNPEYFFHTPVTIINTFTSLGLKSGLDTAAYDIQFFPEGGNLVKGITSTVGFKITDKHGRGVEASGTLLDQAGNSIVAFKTLKFGHGRFSFTPAEAASYTASITLPGNTKVIQKLPEALPAGFVIRLEDLPADNLKITVQTNFPEALSDDIMLLGHARQQTSFSAMVRLKNGQTEFLIPKKEIADGITHFTLFNAAKQPLCERLYFKQPSTKLVIQAATDKIQYSVREKVQLQVNSLNGNQLPLAANLSVAVYRQDSLPVNVNTNINSYLWLTSDLPGFIENPDYYFTNNTPESVEAADNLMLTQGWRRFNWQTVLGKEVNTIKFLPELNGHIVQGRITSKLTGKPLPGLPVFLASPGRHIRLYNALSNENGSVFFDLKDFYGPREILMQTNTNLDSTYSFEVQDPFSRKFANLRALPIALSQKFKSTLTERHLHQQVQAIYNNKYSNLYKPAFTDSIAFYGKADETYLLDDFTRFKVMEEVMREYVPGVQVRIRKDGFHFMVFDKVNKTIFEENPLVLLDGVPVSNINKIMAVDPLNIQKLEVVTSRYLHGPLTYPGLVSFTTYKGNLEGYKLNPNTFVQEYEGLLHQREFYAPRYATAADKQSRLPDLRNLLYWNPEVKTGTTPNQPLDFYTSDKAGKYLVVIQGLSTNGLGGSTSFSIEVKQAL